jgi:hypothetical protein
MNQEYRRNSSKSFLTFIVNLLQNGEEDFKQKRDHF